MELLSFTIFYSVSYTIFYCPVATHGHCTSQATKQGLSVFSLVRLGHVQTIWLVDQWAEPASPKRISQPGSGETKMNLVSCGLVGWRTTRKCTLSPTEGFH